MNRLFTALLAGMALVSPALADMYQDGSNAKLPDARGNLGVPPHVATNAALAAATTANYPSGVWRDDYAAGNGAPPLWFLPKTGTCASNSLVNDGGSCVNSAAGNSFAAIYDGGAADLREWGASVLAADNQPAIQAALSAVARTGTVLVIAGGVYKTGSALTATGAVRIKQVPQGSGTSMLPTTACAVGLREIAVNVATLTMTGDGITLDGLCIDNSTISNTTTGSIGISLGKGSHMVLRDVQVAGACIPLDVSGGNSANQNLSTTIDHGAFMPANATGCKGIEVGKLSTNGATTNLVMYNTAIYCFPAPTGIGGTGVYHKAEGLVVHDVGALYLYGGGNVGCVYGTHLIPLTNGQGVNDMQVNGGVVGDSDSLSSLMIDTTLSGTANWVTHISFNGAWFANYPKNPPTPAINIQNTGGGTVGSIMFSNNRILAPEGADGIWALAGSANPAQDVIFDGNQICNRGTSNPSSLLVIGKVSRTSIRGNTFGTCDVNNPAVIADGIAFATGAAYNFVQVTDNTFDHTSVTSPILNPSTVPINGTLMARNNVGIDEIYPTVASASAIMVPVNPTFYISGTTDIGNMVWTGGPTTRTIIPTGVFNWGATDICGSPPATVANVPLLAVYDGTCWHIK